MKNGPAFRYESVRSPVEARYGTFNSSAFDVAVSNIAASKSFKLQFNESCSSSWVFENQSTNVRSKAQLHKKSGIFVR
jgi:hypothetical protein